MRQPDLIHFIVESAARLSRKVPGWHNPPGRYIVGDAPIGKAIHFKNAAARARADKAFAALNSKGEEMSPKEVGRILAPNTNVVPLYRGATRETVARITEILAPQPTETSDVPSK